MARVEVSALISATPQRVWEVLADLPGQKAWMVDVRRLEITSSQKSGAGTVIEVTSELFGLPLVHDVMEITDWQPGKRFGVVHRGGFTGTGAFELEPAPGGTRFTWWEDFKPPLGALGELVHALLVRPHLERVFARSTANLKALAEASAKESPRRGEKLARWVVLPLVIGVVAVLAPARLDLPGIASKKHTPLCSHPASRSRGAAGAAREAAAVAGSAAHARAWGPLTSFPPSGGRAAHRDV
jgi:hypothetical protein